MRHFDFDRITIQEMSKEDMLMIIQALEYTGHQTKIEAFLNLRENLLEELSSLADLTPETFLDYLRDEAMTN